MGFPDLMCVMLSAQNMWSNTNWDVNQKSAWKKFSLIKDIFHLIKYHVEKLNKIEEMEIIGLCWKQQTFELSIAQGSSVLIASYREMKMSAKFYVVYLYFYLCVWCWFFICFQALFYSKA